MSACSASLRRRIEFPDPAAPQPLRLLQPQVEKAVKTRRAKLVLLAPNIASIEEPEEPAAAAAAAAEAEGAAGGVQGGADSAGAAAGVAAGSQGASGGGGGAESPATALVSLAREREVPLVFALSRQRMGKVSC